MPRFYREEEYVGHSNQRINELNKHLVTLNKMIKTTEDSIDKIQSECDHHYQFSSSGMYEDNYVCKHCGHETER